MAVLAPCSLNLKRKKENRQPKGEVDVATPLTVIVMCYGSLGIAAHNMLWVLWVL